MSNTELMQISIEMSMIGQELRSDSLSAALRAELEEKYSALNARYNRLLRERIKQSNAPYNTSHKGRH